MEIDAEVRRVAIKLCEQARYSSSAQVKVGDGFMFPMWVCYVSHAQRLVDERAAFAKS